MLIIEKNYFWIVICILYITMLTITKFDTIKTYGFWFGVVSCLVCLDVVRAFLLKKTISLSVYDLKHPEHLWLRLLWFLVGVFWLLYYPFITFK